MMSSNNRFLHEACRLSAKYGLYLLIFIGRPSSLCAQNMREVDSLQRVLDTAQTIKVRFNAMYQMAAEMRKTKVDTAMMIGRRMLKLALLQKDKFNEARSYNILGLTHVGLGQFDSAIYFYRLMLERALEIGDKKLIALAYNDVGNPYINSGRMGEAFETKSKALTYYLELADSNRIAAVYNDLGRILGKLKRYEEAKSYMFKGLDINLRSNNNPYYSYSRLGELYAGLNKYDSAILFQQLALEHATKVFNWRGVAIEKNNIGENLILKGDYDGAKKMLKEALDFFETKKDRVNTPFILCNLADAETHLKNYAAALSLLHKALEFHENENNLTVYEKIYEVMSKAYAGAGDYKKAYEASVLHRQYQQKVDEKEGLEQLNELEARFKNSEQQNTISRQQIQLARQRNRNQIMLGLFLLLIAGGLTFAYYLRAKRRQAELQLKLEHTEAARLRDLDRVKSAFFANISHEFRTPLTLILGPLSEMESGVFKGNAQKYFGIMRRNAQRLLELVNQLLDLSRLESGKLQLQKQSADLPGFLRAITGSFESLADRKQIDFSVRLPAGPLICSFDGDKLEKILSNLLSNAFKFTPDEGKVACIAELAPTVNGYTLFIEVRDSGSGIPREQIGHIFDRFFMVENREGEMQPGSGIGLALTRELVDLHKGQIRVESEEGEGAAIFVSLPVDPAGGELARPATHFSSVKSENQNGEEEKVAPSIPRNDLPAVLIVEDNPDVRAYIAEHLQDQYNIMEAVDGESGLSAAREKMPDLIITDLMMPKFDGLELSRKLKEDLFTSHIPIVMLTAKAGRSDKLEGLGKGAESYLTKPFDPEELRLVVANTLAQRKILREKYGREIRLGVQMPREASLDDKFLQQVLVAVEENLDDENFGVEQLAAAVFMSRSYLYRKLESLTGKSPNTLIRELRLQKARALIESGACTVTEAAFRVGFNSAGYFSTCFKEFYGLSPAALRATN